MAQQTINNGTVAGDGTGESLFSAFGKVNANETELYTSMASLEGRATALEADVAVLAATTDGILGMSIPRVVYVNQNTGLDTNDGLSRTTAFKSIARLTQETIGPGTTIMLARGSVWREQLVVGDNVTIKACDGSGALPLLNASDVLSGAAFTAYSGVTYSIGVTRSGNSPRVYENGALLTRRATIAEVDANPGSFVVLESGVVRARDYQSAASVSWTVYVHPLGSTNPATDGKVYEVTMRKWGLTTGANCAVEYVHTTKQDHPDGSMIVGHGGYIKGCVASDGAKHNLWITSGLCEDSIAVRNEGYLNTGSSTLFIAYSTVYGLDVTFKRCKAVDGMASGYYSHTDGGGSYKRIQYDDCEIVDAGGTFGANECDQLIVERCRIFNNNDTAFEGASLAASGGVVSATYIDCEVYSHKGVNYVFKTPNAGQSVDVRGGKFYNKSGSFARVDNAGTLKIEGAKICFDHDRGSSATSRVFDKVGDPAADVTFNYNVIQDGSEYLLSTAATYTMDYNVGAISGAPAGTNKHGLLAYSPFLAGDPRNGNWSMRPDLPRPGVTINAIAHTGGGTTEPREFIAVGDDGFVRFFDTGINTIHSAFWRNYLIVSPSANDLFGAVWLSRIPSFLVVGAAGGIYESLTVGQSWTTRTPPAGLEAATFRAIADDGTNTIAVGDGGVIIRSTDAGATWAQIASGTTDNLYAVAYGGGKWVAVGAAGRICTSADGGATWATTTSGTNDYRCAIYGDAKWVIGGVVGMLKTSSDAITWTQRYTATFHNIMSIAYGVDNFGSGKKTWVAVMTRYMGAGGLVMRSDDPTVAWEEVDSPIETDWKAVAFKSYQDSIFMIAGKGDVTLATARGGGFRMHQIPTRQTRYGATPSNWLPNVDTLLANL